MNTLDPRQTVALIRDGNLWSSLARIVQGDAVQMEIQGVEGAVESSVELVRVLVEEQFLQGAGLEELAEDAVNETGAVSRLRARELMLVADLDD